MTKIETKFMNKLPPNKNKEEENLDPRMDLDEKENKNEEEIETEVEIDPIAEIAEVEVIEFASKFTADQKVYWTEEQEEAIQQYLREDNEIKRNLIFKQKLLKPFNKLIENIIFTYKLFRSDVDIKTQQSDCLSFVMTKFSNFAPEKNYKAFSFFGTIAKHYLMCHRKETYKFTKSNVDYDANQDEVNNNFTYELTDESHLEKSARLFDFILKEIKAEIDKKDISENDKKVGDAIISIFENHEVLALYNKNVLYQIIKERTGLQTKEITYSLSRFRVFYRISKQSFNKKEK